MPTRNWPGEITPPDNAFSASGVVEAQYSPRPGSLVSTYLVRATQDGTVELLLQHAKEGFRSSLGAPVAIVANALLSDQINFPLAEMGFVVAVRYVNTDAQAGLVRFWATDNAK